MLGKATRTVLFVLATIFVASSSVADPAEVVKFGPGECNFGWVNAALSIIMVPGEQGIFVTTDNGPTSFVCHGQIPDDLPQAGDVLPLFGFNGAGVFDIGNTGVLCGGGIVPLTADWQQTVTLSGRVTVICKYP